MRRAIWCVSAALAAVLCGVVIYQGIVNDTGIWSILGGCVWYVGGMTALCVVITQSIEE